MGALVYVLDEGWKEFKVGTISEVEEEAVLNPLTLEENPKPGPNAPAMWPPSAGCKPLANAFGKRLCVSPPGWL
jgi:hypothetical protein